MKEKFTRKNDIGVSIEYYIVGYFEDEGKQYRIYTDFVTDKTNLVGIRLFVDVLEGENYKPVSEEEKNSVLERFHSNILDYIEKR